MIELKDIRELDAYLKEGLATLLYFSTPQCSVCHAMKPKIEAMMENYSNHVIHIDAAQFTELAGQYIVFVAPTLLVVENDKELLRESRFIDLQKVQRLLDIYST